MAEQSATTGPKRPEFAALLGMNPLFAGLGDEAIRGIAGLCTRRSLEAGETLFQKGDKGDALFDGQPRTADAIGDETSELFMVRRADFLSYLEREPRITLRLLEMLCQRIRWVSDRMEEAVLLPLHARLARRLLALGDDFGSEVHISQEDLGVYVGAARESVNRQLQEWRRAGIIELKRGRVLLIDTDRLQAAASGGES